jgi:hypothetical protein
MGLANRAALEAGIGTATVGVACGAVLVFTTPYAYQAARINIAPRHTKNRPIARPDWEGDAFGELEPRGFICCRSFLILYL